MGFIFYDIIFLVLFSAFLVGFLYLKRENLKKEGSLVLYKTQWGVKLIKGIGERYKKILFYLSYVSIGMGYILMASILALIVQTVYIYLTTPIAQTIRVPPVMPLIPYFPRLFGLQSIFPDFYFTYFILAIIIVATVHEFSHGIFAKSFGIKIKSTGFAFLKYFPAFFGAFVEQDDKQMNSKSSFAQKSVLSAGVFANMIIVVLFFFLMAGFFSFAFVPSGVVFNDYSYSVIGVENISSVNEIQVNQDIEKIFNLLNASKFGNLRVNGESYAAIKGISEDKKNIALYENAPAINAKLFGAISEINGHKIQSMDNLVNELMKYSGGDKVQVKAISDNGVQEYEIVLEENPEKGKGYLGIGFSKHQSPRLLGKIYLALSFFKESNVYYAPRFELSGFIYDLLWWIILINFAVALFNMLPLGILDGGRFFYLTILELTRSEKIAKKSFRYITMFLLALFLILMMKWVWVFLVR